MAHGESKAISKDTVAQFKRDLMHDDGDGASYHSSKSARDRDRLRQGVLEQLGWDIHRIWSTSWFEDPRKETERLKHKLLKTLEEKQEIQKNGTANLPEKPESKLDVEEGAGQESEFGDLSFVRISNKESTRQPTQVKEKQISTAKVLKMPTSEPRISPGDLVNLLILPAKIEKTFAVVRRSEDLPGTVDKFSIETPLAQAILDSEEDEEVVTYIANNRQNTAKIISITKRSS